MEKGPCMGVVYLHCKKSWVPRLGCLSFNAAICTPIISCWILCCSYAITQCKIINWIFMQSVVKLLQVCAICLQHSHDDVIG